MRIHFRLGFCASLVLGCWLVLFPLGANAASPIRVTGADSNSATATPTPTAAVARPQTPTPVLATANTQSSDNTTARPKPIARPFTNQVPSPTATETATPEATPTPTPAEPTGPVRLNDSVLRWLPEILNASMATGVPPELIAAVMRVESEGNPSAVSPAGARGLMQIMPSELEAQGIPASAWHDPATNIMAGAVILMQRSGSGWAGAVGAYFGYGCDAWGTCTDIYINAVLGWVPYYASIIGSPLNSGLMVLASDWAPPAIVPYVTAAIVPEPAPAPSATPQPNETAVPTAVPTNTATPVVETPTPIPTEQPTTIPPTEVPPTTIPPTEVPPTDVPVEQPTVEEPPIVVPPADTPPADQPVGEGESGN